MADSVPPNAPHVLVLSDDPLIRELVAELLSQERFRVSEAGALDEARAAALRDSPCVVLLDAIVDGSLAAPILADPAVALGYGQCAIVLIAGAGTPQSVREHPLVDRVLPQPLTADVLVTVVRHCASWQSSRQMQSGTRLRPGAAAPSDDREESGS